jgi:single-stranded DNA-binding protein
MPNKCNLHLEGHLGKDAASWYTTNGKLFVTFSVAFSKGKKDDPKKPPPVWFSCKCVGQAAQEVQGLMKGAGVVITQAIPEVWTDRDGNERLTWVVFEAIPWQKPPAPNHCQEAEPVFDDDEIPF